MFKVYFPFQWLFKGILLLLLGLILFGSYLTIKARYFPEEKPVKIVTGKAETVNYYYELPSEIQNYQIVIREADGYFVGLPFTL